MDFDDLTSRKRMRLADNIESPPSSVLPTPPLQDLPHSNGVYSPPDQHSIAEPIETIDMTGITPTTMTPAREVVKHFCSLQCASCGAGLTTNHDKLISKQFAQEIGACQRKPTTISALVDAAQSVDPAILIGLRVACVKCHNTHTCFGCGRQVAQTRNGAEGDGISLAWHCDKARFMLIWFFLYGYDCTAKHENPKAKKESTPVKKNDRKSGRGSDRGRGSYYGRGGRGGGKNARGGGNPKGVGYGGNEYSEEYDDGLGSVFDEYPSEDDDDISVPEATEYKAELERDQPELWASLQQYKASSGQHQNYHSIIGKMQNNLGDHSAIPNPNFSKSGFVLGSNPSSAPPPPLSHDTPTVLPPITSPFYPYSYTVPHYPQPPPPGIFYGPQHTPNVTFHGPNHPQHPGVWSDSQTPEYWGAYPGMPPPPPKPSTAKIMESAQLKEVAKQQLHDEQQTFENEVMAKILAEDAELDFSDPPSHMHAPYFRNRNHRTAAPIFEDADDVLTSQLLAVLVLLLPNTDKREVTAFDLQPPDGLISILQQSSLLDRVGELLRNDSVEDAARRGGLYEIVLRFVRIISSHHSLRQSLFVSKRAKRVGNLTSTATTSSTDTSPSLLSCMDGLVTQARMITKQAERDHSDFATDEGQRLLWIANSICELAGSLAPPSETQSARPTTKTSTVDLAAWSREFGVLEIADDTIITSHTYGKDASRLADTAPGRMRELLKEITRLKTGLPPGIYLRYGESRMDIMKVLITGPEDTPYENGLWEFDVFAGPNFPNEPPKVYFRTTGGGTVRVNPNLYEDGKVCLSLLGTWSGEPWRPGQSTLLQVLVSIQAMIFCDEPHCNEPSYENERGSDRSRDYNRRVYSMTVKHAMLEWLSPGIKFDSSYRNGRMLGGPGGHRKDANVTASDGIWKDVVSKHFEANKEKIVSTVAKWCEDKPAPRRYSTRSRGHSHAHAHVHGPGHILGGPTIDFTGAMQHPPPPMPPPYHGYPAMAGTYQGYTAQSTSPPPQGTFTFPSALGSAQSIRQSLREPASVPKEVKQTTETDKPVDLVERLKEAAVELTKTAGPVMW
ncbi:hypothetical protein LTR78_003553 [Recurvomyces mirabilis]|uniref:UBC core domain-containing protein n=1 Tax=Recurvomyces mirabilis TaxID=574656 RepID=A0AAE0WRV5_9PEZI|nr:hypothetical protein LTR78_003553 [Recurvomyces mirabilis]KAK5154415.1 hypothetical protein LTS14_006550 [Recurvomyces mirabilis]